MYLVSMDNPIQCVCMCSIPKTSGAFLCNIGGGYLVNLHLILIAFFVNLGSPPHHTRLVFTYVTPWAMDTDERIHHPSLCSITFILLECANKLLSVFIPHV